jgi:hypothetical protein
MVKLDPQLTRWLNHEVYPHLTHEMIFGEWIGFTQARSKASWYATCPYCQHKGTFYMIDGQHAGQCKSCFRTIGWFGYLCRKLGSDPEAIELIADLARITPRPCA